MRHLVLVCLLLPLVPGCHKNANDESAGKPTAPPPSGKKTEDRAAWKKLRTGMSEDNVKAIMGEPLKTQSEADVLCWHYNEGQQFERNATEPNKWTISRGSMLFSTKGGAARLAEWREP